jgi:hypothetical protein
MGTKLANQGHPSHSHHAHMLRSSIQASEYSSLTELWRSSWSGLPGEPMPLRCLAFSCSWARRTSGYRHVHSVCDHYTCEGSIEAVLEVEVRRDRVKYRTIFHQLRAIQHVSNSARNNAQMRFTNLEQMSHAGVQRSTSQQLNYLVVANDVVQPLHGARHLQQPALLRVQRRRVARRQDRVAHSAHLAAQLGRRAERADLAAPQLRVGAVGSGLMPRLS